jgi:putative aminopeptidase FrvX
VAARSSNGVPTSTIGSLTAVRYGKQAEISIQIAAHNRGTGTDANAIQLTRAGIATGLISIPNRYMHSAVETIALDDIDKAAELIAEFVPR